MKLAYDHPESRREVLLLNGQTMSRADAALQGYDVKPYVDLVAPADRVAATHPVHTDLVTVPPFGLTVTRDTARAMGFTVSAVADASRAATSRADPNRSWRTAIMTLPEANARPSAAAELLSTQSPATMTTEAARAFLCGLPPEQPDEETTTMTTQNDPRAARLAEIDGSMRAFNRDRGYAGKPVAAPSLNSVEPTKLKRLAEIRLGALAMRVGKGETAVANEHKKLAYAMSVHDQTGVPLATVFTQMGVDTSKMLANISTGA